MRKMIFLSFVILFIIGGCIHAAENLEVSLKVGADNYNGNWIKNNVQVIAEVPEEIPNLTDIYYKKSTDSKFVSLVNTIYIQNTIVLTFDETINENITFVGVDVAGHPITLPSNAYNIKIDKSKPVVNSVTTTQEGAKVIVIADAYDNESGVKSYSFSDTGVASVWNELNPTMSNGNITIELSESGLYKLWLKDEVGNISLVEEVDVYKDITAPTGMIEIFGNLIDGVTYVNSRNVEIVILAIDDVTTDENMKMKVLNEEEFRQITSFDNIEWEPYKEKIEWQLSEGDGLKTVYLLLRDEAGNVSLTLYEESVDYIVYHFIKTEDGTAYNLHKYTKEKAKKGETIVLSDEVLPIPDVTLEKASLSYDGPAITTIIPNADGTTEIFLHYSK